MSFTVSEVWLMLLKEGGRWKAKEVAGRIGMHASDTARNLKHMSESGMVKRWEPQKPGDYVLFGVTIAIARSRGAWPWRM